MGQIANLHSNIYLLIDFKKSTIVFLTNVLLFTLRKDETCIWTTWIPFIQRWFMWNFCWNWRSIFRAEDFEISLCFYYIRNGELTFHLFNSIFFSLKILLTALDLVYLYWTRIFLNIAYVLTISYFFLFGKGSVSYILH